MDINEEPLNTKCEIDTVFKNRLAEINRYWNDTVSVSPGKSRFDLQRNSHSV